jgi:hypothetical protein
MWLKLSKTSKELALVGLVTLVSMFFVHNMFQLLKSSPQKTPVYTSSSSPESTD